MLRVQVVPADDRYACSSMIQSAAWHNQIYFVRSENVDAPVLAKSTRLGRFVLGWWGDIFLGIAFRILGIGWANWRRIGRSREGRRRKI